MQPWIAATLAAAFLQNLRFMAQRHLRRTRLSTAGATFARFLWGAPLAVLFTTVLVVARGDTVPGTSAGFWGFAMLGGLAQILATMCVVALFAGRNFAVGIALKKTETLQTALIAWLVLGEGIGPWALAAILIGFVGVLFLSDPPAAGPAVAPARRLFNRSAVLGIASGALFGVSATAYRGATLALDGGDGLLRAAITLSAVTTAQSLALGLWLLWREPGQVRSVIRAGRAVAVAGITGIAGSLCWFTAFALQTPAYVKALGQVELLFSLAASWLVFHEQMTRRELAGAALIALSVLGIVLAGQHHGPARATVPHQVNQGLELRQTLPISRLSGAGMAPAQTTGPAATPEGPHTSLHQEDAMRSIDLTPLYRASVGFDQFADLLDRVFSQEVAQPGYPPFNIEKTAEDAYRISLAVAGFTDDELSVEVRDNALIVAARRTDDKAERSFLHRGIAERSFEKRFQLADHIKVTGAVHENGMLHVDLAREVPEALKPRQIAITSVDARRPTMVEAEKAA